VNPEPAPTRRWATHTPGRCARERFTYDGGSDPPWRSTGGPRLYANIIFDGSRASARGRVACPQGAGAASTTTSRRSAGIRGRGGQQPAIAPDKEFVTADISASSPNRTTSTSPDDLRRTRRAPTSSSRDLRLDVHRPRQDLVDARADQPASRRPSASPQRPSPRLDPHSSQLRPGLRPRDPANATSGDLQQREHARQQPQRASNSRPLRSAWQLAGGNPHLNCAGAGQGRHDVTVVNRSATSAAGRGMHRAPSCAPTTSRARRQPRATPPLRHLAGLRTGAFDVTEPVHDGGATWTEATAAVNPDRGKVHYRRRSTRAAACGGGPQPGCPTGSGATPEPKQPLFLVRAGGAGDQRRRSRRPRGGQLLPHVPGRQRDRAGRLRRGRQPQNCVVFTPGQQPASRRSPPTKPVRRARPEGALRGPPGLADLPAARRPPDGLHGDYSGLTVVATSHPIWSDQRVSIPAASRPTRGHSRRGHLHHGRAHPRRVLRQPAAVSRAAFRKGEASSPFLSRPAPPPVPEEGVSRSRSAR